MSTSLTLGRMNQKGGEPVKHPEFDSKHTATFEELTSPFGKWQKQPSVSRGNVDSEEIDELLTFFERERFELELYFENKMQQFLQGIQSSNHTEGEETKEEGTPVFEEILTKRNMPMGECLEDEEKCLKDQLFLKSIRGTKELQNMAKTFEQEDRTSYGDDLEGIVHEVVSENQQLDTTRKNDQSQLDSYFNLRLEASERNLQSLNDEFKRNVVITRPLMVTEGHGNVAKTEGRVITQYPKIFIREMSHERKEEARREKPEIVTKSKKGKRQLEQFVHRLREAEENLESLQIEVRNRIESARHSRRKIEAFTEKLKSECEMKLRSQILCVKEESRREIIEMEERFRKEKHDIEEGLTLKLTQAETGLKKLKAEGQQKDRMEKENRDTIIKLEGKLQEERQLRHVAERELKLKKAEESLKRNENEQLRNEVVGLRREITQKDKELKSLREMMERESNRDTEGTLGSIRGKGLVEFQNEKISVETFALPREIKDDIAEITQELEGRGKEKEEDQIDLNASAQEGQRYEVDSLRQEIEDKSKEIERLLAIKQDNELKILNLARRLEKRGKGCSKGIDLRSKKYANHIASPELSNKTSSDDGDRTSARTSWYLEGSLLGWEAGTLKADQGKVISSVDNRRKLLISVTFEKHDEPGILGLLMALLPRQKVTPTIRVSMT